MYVGIIAEMVDDFQLKSVMITILISSMEM